MGSIARLVWWGTVAAVAATVAGIVVLFAYSASEVLANPGYSLEDGYWAGHEPWISIGVSLTLFGATAVVLLGVTSTFIDRSWLGLVVVIPLVVAGFFWFVALLPPPSAVPCDPCPQRSADPITYAYSSPGSTVVFLLIPTLVVAVIAFLARPRHESTPNILTA